MGLMKQFLSWLLINEQPEERDTPSLSYRNFIPDPRILDGRKKLRPSMQYTRDLQYCYMELLDYLGQNSLFDVASIREQYNFLHGHACELERLLQRTIGEKDALQARLDLALEWQTESGRKSEVYTENGYAPVEKKEQPRNGTQFASKSGRTGLENKKLVASMVAYDIDVEDIARELDLSVSTVYSYMSFTKNKYYTVDMEDGLHIQFQGDLGNDNWNLDKIYGARYQYQADDNGTQEAYNGDIATTIGGAGEIHHGLQKPVF